MKKSTEIKKGKKLVHPTNALLNEKELVDEIMKAEAGDFYYC